MCLESACEEIDVVCGSLSSCLCFLKKRLTLAANSGTKFPTNKIIQFLYDNFPGWKTGTSLPTERRLSAGVRQKVS